MKRLQRHLFGALSRGLDDSRFHLSGGFVGKRQAQDIFPRQRSVRLQQVPDTFGDNPRFSRSRPRNYQKRPFSMRDRALLRVIQLQSALAERFHLKQSGHRLEGYRISS